MYKIVVLLKEKGFGAEFEDEKCILVISPQQEFLRVGGGLRGPPRDGLLVGSQREGSG